jgi:hypothetical protein
MIRSAKAETCDPACVTQPQSEIETGGIPHNGDALHGRIFV